MMRQMFSVVQVFQHNEYKLLKQTITDKMSSDVTTTTPLAILLNFELGLRVGELCSIKWSDIIGKYIHVQRMEVHEYELTSGKNVHVETNYSKRKVVEYTKTLAGDRKSVV